MAFCPQCGAPIAPGAAFCSACGAMTTSSAPVDAAASPPAPVATHMPAPGAAQPQRPLGVTIVGIATLVGAGFLALGTLAMLSMGIFFAAVGMGSGAAFEGVLDGGFFGWMAGAFGAMMLFVFLLAAIFMAALVALAIAAGVGVMRGRSWAWPLMLVVLALWVLGGLSGLADGDLGGVFPILVSGLVGWYFFQPEVKTWFGRS